MNNKKIELINFYIFMNNPFSMLLQKGTNYTFVYFLFYKNFINIII